MNRLLIQSAVAMAALLPLAAAAAPEFANPVNETYLADPFCFQHDGTYYAVGTGREETSGFKLPGNAVPMMKSKDLQHWESVGRVLEPPAEERGGCFWAPEIAYRDGTFYLYYHANGTKRGFHVRVATSQSPTGPFVDTGKPLTDLAQNKFAIDSDAFVDDDGQAYLFYATDFLDADDKTFRGTALVMDRLKSMTELEGHPQTVMRAHWPWQLYERNRLMNGVRKDWYTLEGPSVVKRGGKYYCFYSGGNYQNDTYGVDYLVADKITGPWKEVGEFRGPQIMRTVPGKVLGPGHNSIVTSPDGKQDYIVYHAWDPTIKTRQTWVDPLVWTEQGPRIERFAARIEEFSR